MPRRNASRMMSRSSVTASRSKLRSLAKETASCARWGASGTRFCASPCGAFSGLCDNMVGLIAELGRNLPVSGEHLRGSMNFLPVAGIVGGNLRGLRPAEAAPGDGLLDLLAARTGRFKILRRCSPLRRERHSFRPQFRSPDCGAGRSVPIGRRRWQTAGYRRSRALVGRGSSRRPARSY